MVRHKLTLSLLVLLVVALSLGACAAPSTPTATIAASTAQSSIPAAQAAQTPLAGIAATATPSFKLAEKQILRLSLSVEPPTLDPSKAEDSASTDVLKALNHGLVRFAPDLTVEPALAESWQYSTDGKTITFKLRDGLKYSNGKAIQAGDFVYSWKRLLDPRTASPYSTLLLPVKGASAFASAQVPTDTAKLPDLERALGLSAPDNRTFVVDLEQPFSPLLSICALWNTVPLDREAVEAGGAGWAQPPTLVTSGPFMLKEWKRGDSMLLTPNPNYYGQKPILQEVRIAVIAEPKVELEAFKAGELDVANRIPDADVPAVKSSAELGPLYVRIPSLSSYCVGFNLRKPPFDNKLVRQAFSSAVDRQTMSDVIARGVPQPSLSFIPPGMPGYDAVSGFAFDASKAKSLLARAGYADGKGLPELTLSYNSSASHKVRMEFVQDQLKQNLGVTVKLEALEGGAFLNRLRTDTPELFRLGWNADYPHPRTFLDAVFRSTSGSNYGGYKNAEVDKLLDKAAATADPQEQEKLYRQAQSIIVEDAPVIFLYWNATTRLVRPWVKDAVLTPMDGSVAGMLFLDRIKIAAH